MLVVASPARQRCASPAGYDLRERSLGRPVGHDPGRLLGAGRRVAVWLRRAESHYCGIGALVVRAPAARKALNVF